MQNIADYQITLNFKQNVKKTWKIIKILEKFNEKYTHESYE